MVPGPHGGPGGPRGGGHRGGFGGHRGGFGGHHGGWGFGGHFGGWGHDPHRRPINVVPSRYTGGTVSGPAENQYVDEEGKPITEYQYRIKKHGSVKGRIMNLRLTTTGAMKEEMFNAKCATVDDLLSGNRITVVEARKRKMEAAKVYYGYLKKIECITAEEYDEVMGEFAQSIGASYTPQNSNVNRRTR